MDGVYPSTDQDLASKPLPIGHVQPHQLEKVFDLAFFEHCTSGDKALMQELLGLFRGQIEKSAENIIECPNDKDWAFITHTLKGAAAAVGAVQIEMLVSTWEIKARPRRFAERAALAEALQLAAAGFFKVANKL
jgi:HPt (histidine-containing phosphotransfer) domain-containing protein